MGDIFKNHRKTQDRQEGYRYEQSYECGVCGVVHNHHRKKNICKKCFNHKERLRYLDIGGGMIKCFYAKPESGGVGKNILARKKQDVEKAYPKHHITESVCDPKLIDVDLTEAKP